MGWHLAAYTGLVGTVANLDIAALTDDVLTIQNNHFLLRAPMNLLGAYAQSPTISRARLDSPTIRFYGNPMIRPINVGASPLNNPNKMYMFEHPLLLPPGEELAMQFTSAIAMGTEQATGLLWLSNQIDPVPPGNPYAVRATSATAAVAAKWTTIPYTMDQSFPTGAFALINSEVQSTTAIAHRWIFDESTLRAGFLSLTALGNREPWPNYLFRLGMMGRFMNTSLPRLQVLCVAADAAHDIYMTVVKLAA